MSTVSSSIGKLRISFIAMALVPAACLQLQAADISADTLRRLDDYVQSEARRFRLPHVAIAVSHEGQVVHERIYGPHVNRDSAFIIGSCSKTITALATLLALDEAGVDVDANVTSVLPNLDIRGSDQPLKIVHLLQHRSGLTRAQGFDALPSLEALRSAGHTIELRHPPGEQFAYCNLNYALSGLVVESLSHMSFGDFVRRNVFIPAGMDSSSCLPGTGAANAAPEYQYCFGFARRVPKTIVPTSQVPSGFIRCSAHDLATLQIVLSEDGVLDGKPIFPKQIVQRMKTPPGEDGFGYAMGVYRGNHRFGPLVAHEGATPTAYAFHGLLSEDRLGFVFLTNINLFDPFTDHGESIYENILRILKGEQPEKIYPVRIWVRWLVLAAVLLTLWQCSSFAFRWHATGWKWRFPQSARDRISLLVQPVVPIAIWYFVLRWTETPLLTVFQLEPDLMWSFAFLAVAGVLMGCLKKCVPADTLASMQSRRKPRIFAARVRS